VFRDELPNSGPISRKVHIRIGASDSIHHNYHNIQEPVKGFMLE
jgi:hypothetical protein